jgi:acetyl-CoA synthetase
VILRAERAQEQTAEEASVLLRQHVSEAIGAIARPRQIFIVTELPKTRSGKIMRRLLRDVAEGRGVGDTTTLADTTVMDAIANKLSGGARSED